MNNLTVALHGAERKEGGIYNVLNNFTKGLYSAFERKVNISSTLECVERKIGFDFAIGFNVCCFEGWDVILNSNIPNIMWSVDSILAQNFDVINKYKFNPNFIVFSVRSEDIEIAKQIMPELKLEFMPHAVDENFWINKNLEKDLPAVFLSSVCDWEEELNKIRNNAPRQTWDIIKMFFDVLINNTGSSFYDIYNVFCDKGIVERDAVICATIYQTLLPIVESYQKIEMIKALKDFPVKIFGNELWKKYISGKQEYKGILDVSDSVDVLNRAKIVLNNHSAILGGGLHERFLNASAVNSFVFINDNELIKNLFGDMFGYYEAGNIRENFENYLKNDKLRIDMAKNANEYVLKKHTWNNRVDKILSMIIR